ncbi:mercury(II) reductase [Saccharomonospora cyanea]|uniref:Mercuric reductase n=1 Tax=Saccharomonospora cyanea NA-134 TaxID=882082 RepID=H5XEC1_9PSEU|nr:mercury(II) reductase [Saccharomonospora cyanea]EHR61389.1 mercuric reductase [Saccharomonospora cyanea NA-134]
MNSNSQDQIYDLAVIGAGSAAKAAATEARRRGKSVAMVERAAPGGTCLNVGCIPSKNMLAAAAARASAQNNRFPGILTSAGPVDLSLLVEAKDEFIRERREKDHVKATEQAGIVLLRGTASFTPSGQERPTLMVTGPNGEETPISAEHVLIATGAQPFIPDVPGLADVDHLTSASAMSLDRVPESLLVVGGNAIGLEQAQLFSRLGARTTVVELAPRIAPFEDPSISATLQQALTDDGIDFLTGANLTGVQPTGTGVLATVTVGSDKLRIPTEKILVATGRRPATDGLNLDAVGVELGPRGEVTVDEHLRTVHPRIWAAGDVTGQRQFVYVAGAQGVTAVSNIFGDSPRTLDYTAVPRVTFTSPAVASVGLTPHEVEATEQPYETRELPLAFVPRAMVSQRTNGLLKLVSEPGAGRILGVHMVGEEAGEVITAATYLLSAGFTVERLAGTWAPFLTMAESLRIAAQAPPTV